MKLKLWKMLNKIKKHIVDFAEDVKVLCLHVWLFIVGSCLRIWFFIKSAFIYCAVMIFIVASTITVYVFRFEITNYLVNFNTNDNGKTSGVFTNIFTAIGASIIGVIAITFSLSLFAVQQAADKHTPSILAGFLKDKINRIIFWTIAIIALLFLVFAVIPLNCIIFYEVIGALLLIVAIYLLLQKQYRHVTKLINPNYQIVFHHNEAIKALEKTDRWLDLMIKVRAIKMGPEKQSTNDDEDL